MLKEAWIRGRGGAFSVENVRAKLYAYRDLFVNSGAWQRSVTYWNDQKYRPCYVEDLTMEIDKIIVWYENRFKETDDYFKIDATTVSDVKINGIAEDASYYTLTGTRVSDTSRPGVYVRQGKKFLGGRR